MNSFIQNKQLSKLFWLGVVVFSMLGTTAYAQESARVTGSVMDTEGAPIHGVTVIEKGTNNAVMTDNSGAFSIAVSPDGSLVFSGIAYSPQTIPIDNKTSIKVVMEDHIIGLDEYVVVGYGSMKKGEITSAITRVSPDKFIKGMVKGPDQLLQGKVAGLQVANTTGDPTQGFQLTIRGANSISGSTSPLIVIDGIPGGNMSAISSEDIESIDVLKDGSAAAIYGTRGTNGVIIITTKRAKASPATLEYNTSLSIEGIAKRADMLTASDYRELIGDPSFVGMVDDGTDTDWLDAISRNGISHSHYLSLRGGSKSTNYVASIDYRDRQGVIKNTNKESFTVRFSMNHNMFKDKLRIQMNINDSYVTQQRVWYGGAYLAALQQNPTRPIYNPDGSYTEYGTHLKPSNPVSMIKEEYDKEGYNQLMMNGKIIYSPIQELNLSVMGAMQRFDRMENKSNSFKHMSTVMNKDNGNVWNWADNALEKTLELVADYSNSFGRHNVSAMVGYSYQENDNKGLSQWAKNFPTDMFGPWNIGSSNDIKLGKANMTSYRNSHKLISFFGRATYNYKEKYMIMGSLRREGSSRFGDNHKWGMFPAVSAGWRVSKEDFMSNVKFLDDLKLRVGYGVTGTEVGANYLSQYLLDYGSYAYLGGEWTKGVGPNQNPNPDLKWEKKAEINVGIDFAMFKNRFTGTIDLYQRKTSDLMANYNVPVPPNIIGVMLANVGKITNKGVELSLYGRIVDGKSFNLAVSGNVSYNKNKITSLSNSKYKKDYWYEGGTGSPIQTHTHIVQEGRPVGDFHGYETYELDNDGLWSVYGKDGTKKLLRDAGESDKRVIGNGIPTTFAGFMVEAAYKRFDISISFRGAFGFDILNSQRMHWETTQRIGEANLPRSVLNKPFGSTSYVKDTPAFQSYYLENGNYVKLDNLSLGYNFKFKSQSAIKRLRLYAAAYNLLTITGYKGQDPEVSMKGLAPGIEGAGSGGIYPTTRLFTFGVNMMF